ncbi:MAG: hypothetical protein ABW189_02085 [Rickettsiales bacterium]
MIRFSEKSRTYRVYVKTEKNGGDVADVRLIAAGADFSPLLWQIAWPLVRGLPVVACAALALVAPAIVISGKALIATHGESGLGFLLSIYATIVAFFCAFSADLQDVSLRRFSGYSFRGLSYGTSKARAWERAMKKLA